VQAEQTPAPSCQQRLQGEAVGFPQDRAQAKAPVLPEIGTKPVKDISENANKALKLRSTLVADKGEIAPIAASNGPRSQSRRQRSSLPIT
jgi:hypothetical protein